MKLTMFNSSKRALQIQARGHPCGSQRDNPTPTQPSAWGCWRGSRQPPPVQGRVVPALWVSGPPDIGELSAPPRTRGAGSAQGRPRGPARDLHSSSWTAGFNLRQRQHLLLPREVRDPLNQVFIGSQSSWDRTPFCNTFKRTWKGSLKKKDHKPGMKDSTVSKPHQLTERTF